jgi:basic amino acid/polyamine antiporter, APA family
VPSDIPTSADPVDHSASQPNLRKELNVFDAVAIVVGTTIGSSIFLIPNVIAAQLHSLGTVLLVWTVGGFLTVFGALSLAELGSIYPGTGGLATYLHHAYGPLPAFLYAWGLLFMIHSGSIAALALGFGLYAGQAFAIGAAGQKLLSAACIFILTVISCIGIRSGKLTQNLIAIAKISGLAAVIFLMCLKGARPLHLLDFSADTAGHSFPFAGFGIALVAVMWAYEGWHLISFVAGEMKRPQLDLPRALAYGTAAIMLIYLVANLGYYHLLSPAEIRGSDAVAAVAVQKLLGPTARTFLSCLILVSILGSLNGLVITGPRVYFAMARDAAFPKIFGQISARYRTPMFALIVQGIWSTVLALSGTYQQLFTNVIFTAWIFYGLAVAAVVVLRRAQPQLDRPFRVPGYPWFSVLFCAAAAGLVLNTIFQRPVGALIGIGLVASGLPVYFFLVKPGASARKSATADQQSE